MSLKRRLVELERGAFVDLPLTRDELSKWFLMFCVSRGTGHATASNYTRESIAALGVELENYEPRPGEFSEEEWKWFEENGENFEKSLALLEKHRKRIYS